MGGIVIVSNVMEQLRSLPDHSVETVLVLFSPRDEDEFADYAAEIARVLKTGRGNNVITSQGDLADAFLNL